ncbi:MAG: AI-2E family transporter [Actinomycetota bacterium]
MSSSQVRISNAFQAGLFGGLGVLTALLIGGAVASLANVITYVFAAIFLALGLDPVVSLLERYRFPRALAVLTVIVAVLAGVAVMIWALVPAVVNEGTKFLQSAPELIQGITKLSFVVKLDNQLGGALTEALSSAANYISNSGNWPTLLGGVVQVGITFFTGIFGFIVVVVLTIFFLASLDTFKTSIYQLAPGTSRERFKQIADQVSKSVGRYVIGQLSVAGLNALLAFTVMTIVGLEYALVLGFLVFLLAVIPLIGSISGAAIVVIVALAVNPTSALILAIYFLIYLQLEAYVISPRVMKVAVSVPAPIVVIAALSGGALLGVLGALVAVPFAASVIFIIRELFIPRQDSR